MDSLTETAAVARATRIAAVSAQLVHLVPKLTEAEFLALLRDMAEARLHAPGGVTVSF